MNDELIKKLWAQQIELERQNEALRRANITLETSSARHVALYDFAPVGYLTLNTDGRIVEANLTAAELLIIERKHLVNQRFDRFIVDDYQDLWEWHVSCVKQNGGTHRCELLIRRDNGTTLYLHIDCRFINAIDGETWLYVTFSDFTECKKAEEKKLQKLIDRYQLIFDGTQDATWDWDVLNKRVDFSSRWKKLRGFDEDEIDSDENNWSANIHPDDKKRIFAAVQAHFAGSTPVFCEEYRTRCKDGTWKWILDRGIAQRDASGQVIRMAGSESDITARKRIEAALHDRENELQLIINLTPALIAYLDIDFRYVRINSAYDRWWRKPTEFFLGRPVREVVGETSWAIIQPYLEQARLGDRVCFDKIIPYGNNVPRWVQATYIPDKDVEGKVKGILVHVVDIEDRKRAEQEIIALNDELQHRIEEMQVIFDTVPIGLTIAKNTDGVCIRSNSTLINMPFFQTNDQSCCDLSTSSGYRVFDNGHELANHELPIQRALQGTAITSQILEFRHADGHTITVLSNAAPLFDEKGHPRGAISACMDITVLKQAEETIKKNKKLLQVLIEQAPTSIAMFDRDMNYLVTSRRWIEEFGQGYDDLKGHNHYAINSDLPAKWKQIHQQAMIGKFLKNDEDLWIKADGSTQWLRWTAYPWRGTEGNIGGIIVSYEDISSQQQAKEQLRQAQARLALIIEKVNAGYWEWDLLTYVIYFSPEWKGHVGFDDNELPNRYEEWENRLHPDDLALTVETTKNYVTGYLPAYELEFRLRHKDGSYRWIHCRGALLRDKKGCPYRMLGLNLDITGYMESKTLNDRCHKIEASFNSYVASQTAAAIAHELNQPLTAISYYADAAQDMLKTGDLNLQKLSPILEKCGQQALRAGDVMLQLLNLLHKNDITYETLAINTIIQEAIALVAPDRETKVFCLEQQFTDGLPPVKINQLQIQKVMVILLRNSLEALLDCDMSARTITVSTGYSATSPDMVQVTVCDQGHGVMNASQLKTIFQPFYTTKAKGLGMGLAISRTLIEVHGGKLWAEQNADRGLSVHFTLPFYR